MDEPQPSTPAPPDSASLDAAAHGPGPHGAGHPIPSKIAWLVKFAGVLGFTACVAGTAIFLGACCGWGEAFRWSCIPLALGAAGFLLTPIGYLLQKRRVMAEETQVLASLFVSLMAIIGGLLEYAVFRGWPIFPK